MRIVGGSRGGGKAAAAIAAPLALFQGSWLTVGPPPVSAMAIAGAAAPPPSARLTDEGIAYRDSIVDVDHIVNVSPDPYDRRRRELHVDGRTFTHVGETTDGQWVYRADY